jgi:hypothetical protein
MKLMHENEEKYIHFVSCIDDLNNAWRILKLVKNRKNNSLRHIAFRFGLIEYSKPYLRSDGTLAKYKLDKEFIPVEHLKLHGRILDARNKFLAHSDLTIRDAQLYVTPNSSGKFVGIVQNVIHGSEEFENIDCIIDLIEKTLFMMYAERDRMENELPTNFSME